MNGGNETYRILRISQTVAHMLRGWLQNVDRAGHQRPAAAADVESDVNRLLTWVAARHVMPPNNADEKPWPALRAEASVVLQQEVQEGDGQSSHHLVQCLAVIVRRAVIWGQASANLHVARAPACNTEAPPGSVANAQAALDAAQPITLRARRLALWTLVFAYAVFRRRAQKACAEASAPARNGGVAPWLALPVGARLPVAGMLLTQLAVAAVQLGRTDPPLASAVDADTRECTEFRATHRLARRLNLASPAVQELTCALQLPPPVTGWWDTCETVPELWDGLAAAPP